MQNKPIHTIDILLRQFGGQVLIPFRDAALAAGFAEQTARNKQSQGTFPIPTIERECAGTSAKTRKRRLVHIRDLAAYIDELSAPKRGPGRPTKAESLAAKAFGGRQK